jgi:PAS domain S-box-containing protein
MTMAAYPEGLPLLTRVSEIRQLTAQRADLGYPVHIRGVVTYSAKTGVYLQDETGGIYVDAKGMTPSESAGNLVEVHGRTSSGPLTPEVTQTGIRRLGAGTLPKPRRLPYLDLAFAEQESQWVALRCRIRMVTADQGRLAFWTAPAGHRFPVLIEGYTGGSPERFIGALVEVRGVCVRRISGRQVLLGFQLLVPGMEQVTVVDSQADPWSAPEVSVPELLRPTRGRDPNRLVRLQGLVEFQQFGSGLFLWGDGQGLYVKTEQRTHVEPGDRIELLGFPALGEYGPVLEDSTFRKMGGTAAIPVARIAAERALSGASNAALVQVEGRLLSRTRSRRRQILALRSGGAIFDAELADAGQGSRLPDLRDGCLLRLTGVCQIQSEGHWKSPQGFHLLLRSPRDIQILKQPPWLTAELGAAALAAMGALILGAAVWASVLRRRVLAQTAIIRKRLEHEALLEKRYGDLFENANDMVYSRDLDGFMTDLNPAGERMTGYTRAEFLKMRILDMIPPELGEQVRQLMEVNNTKTPDVRAELDIIRKDGERRTLEVSTRLISEDGKPVRVEGIARDVTDRKRAQAEYETAREAAEEANRAKSEFLANMSHEIRTPMNGVIGMSELALQTDLTLEQREYVDTIRTCAESLLTLINDILDFSKIEARKLELDWVEFDIRRLLADILRTLRVRSTQRNLVLRSSVEDSVPQRLLGDPHRVRQVIVNLVGNGIKFTERGEVAVDVALEREEEGKCRLHFAVRDTGIGIPEGKRKSVFDAFMQGDGSITRKHGGTGLGLAISAQLAVLMHGTISVESRVGEGSVFHFTAEFGVATGTMPAHLPAPSAPKRHSRPLKILVVEDNAVNRRLAAKLLEKRGHRVQVVCDGRAALDTIPQQPFDLILMDVQMPEMDGFQATAAIRERETTTGSHIPILALTAHAMKGDRERCLDAGMDGYVSKPIQPSELFAAIDALADSPEPPVTG